MQSRLKRYDWPKFSANQISIISQCLIVFQVKMTDMHTNEELVFTCGKWMSRDEDDGEICREMAAQRVSVPESQVLPGNMRCCLLTVLLSNRDSLKQTLRDCHSVFMNTEVIQR
jgi:hypothetical protein